MMKILTYSLVTNGELEHSLALFSFNDCQQLEIFFRFDAKRSFEIKIKLLFLKNIENLILI